MSSKLYFLPIVGSITSILAFCTAYIMAVVRGDVYPWWPYISDTGTTIPESCIFGELLTITAIIGLIVVFIRFKWIQSIETDDSSLRHLNWTALVIGVISCIAMTFVANFEETSLRAVHMPSSSITFGFAIIYNFLHSAITKKISPTYGSACLWLLRLSLSILGLISFGLLYGFGVGAAVKGKAYFGNDSKKRLEWSPEDPGWGLHLVSTISEWVVGISVILYYLTFCKDFANIRLNIKSESMYDVNSVRTNTGANALGVDEDADDDVIPIWSSANRTD